MFMSTEELLPKEKSMEEENLPFIQIVPIEANLTGELCMAKEFIPLVINLFTKGAFIIA